jgi:hypothetical protein
LCIRAWFKVDVAEDEIDDAVRISEAATAEEVKEFAEASPALSCPKFVASVASAAAVTFVRRRVAPADPKDTWLARLSEVFDAVPMAALLAVVTVENAPSAVPLAELAEAFAPNATAFVAKTPVLDIGPIATERKPIDLVSSPKARAPEAPDVAA